MGGNIKSFHEKLDKKNNHHKKVILILVDSMMGGLVDSSVKKGNVPALQFLIENGQYYKDVVAPFPTMSVTIESSIITGVMPDKHKIPGLAWYHPKEDRIVNYGTSLGILMRSGFHEGVKDALFHLNNTHLSPEVTTIFEELDQKGKTSGAINTLLYRGNYLHRLTLPPLADEVLNVPEAFETKGPHVLAFGKFSKPEILEKKELSDGYAERLGLNDQYSVEVTQQLIKQGDQPDFLMIFLPDYDKIVHKEGPHYRKGFEDVELYIQSILNSYDSWQEAIDDNIIILLGDHGQDHILADENELGINLDYIYRNYRISSLREPVSHGEIAFAVNQRMTYVYDVHNQNLIPSLVEQALTEPKIDLIAWKDHKQWVEVASPNDQRRLRFKPGGEWEDEYGQTWEIEGEPEVMGVRIDSYDKRKISYIDNPDGFNQLYSALESQKDAPTLVLTAKPGHSFQSEGTPTHPDGGEHGGLHRNDSLAAMIIAGTDQKPPKLRMVDLKQYIMDLLTENPEWRKQSSLVKEAKEKEEKEEPPKVKRNIANKTKEIVTSTDGVIGAVSVALDKELFVAVEVERWHRFRLKTLRSDLYELLSHRFKDYKVYISTDWKIYREIKKLEDEIDGLSGEEVKKRLEKIEKSMKG